MASMLQNLIRRSSGARIIASLHRPASQNLAAPCVFHRCLVDDELHGQSASNSNSVFASPKLDDSISSQFSHIYPSFPFGFSLPQISPIGSVSGYGQPDDSRSMWADSVKKKRKRKMNKHKYKKLRKRLRRQT